MKLHLPTEINKHIKNLIRLGVYSTALRIVGIYIYIFGRFTILYN